MFRFREAGRFVRDFAAGVVAPAVTAMSWRQRRFLVLGYHGVSLEDEHLWDGRVYVSPERFRSRLRILQETKCAVLPLDTALRQLSEGTLPPRAVVLAFDDGFSDFARLTAPILTELGYPATVYLTSYYSAFNRPVFDIMLRYLLWKGGERTITLPGILSVAVKLDSDGQRDVYKKLQGTAFDRQMTATDKDELLASVAYALNIDYEDLCRRRLLHIMNAQELRAVKAQGFDIQMHSHRHRVSRNRELFAREIHENRRWIQQTVGGPAPVHFSFPGGVFEPVERQWMSDLGIQSAVTGLSALADPSCDRLHLPRFSDDAFIGERHFRAWLSGSMAFFPRAQDCPTQGQILEETIPVSDSPRAFKAGAGR